MSRVDLINWDESCECKHSYPPLFTYSLGVNMSRLVLRLRFRKAALQGVELIAYGFLYGSVFLGINDHDQQSF